MDILNAEDLLPEFERKPALVNGVRYVIAARSHCAGDHLHITAVYPVYEAPIDSWRFPDGGCRRRAELDLWLPLDEYASAEARAWDRNRLRTTGLFQA